LNFFSLLPKIQKHHQGVQQSERGGSEGLVLVGSELGPKLLAGRLLVELEQEVELTCSSFR